MSVLKSHHLNENKSKHLLIKEQLRTRKEEKKKRLLNHSELDLNENFGLNLFIFSVGNHSSEDLDLGTVI